MAQIVREAGARTSTRDGALERWARRALKTRLRELTRGQVVLVDGDRSETFGKEGTGPSATLQVLDPSFYRAVVLRGTLGAAEAYMDGSWRSDDLTSLVRILAQNLGAWSRVDGRLARIFRSSAQLVHELRRNTRGGSRRNIEAHYDLGNEFFELFLDPTLTYSSGIFEREDASMEEASLAKYDRVCRKLGLGPKDHVLEIGTGWGGFALHAARKYGCRVTTTTISKEQHALASQRVAEAGLGHRIEIRSDDYRDLDGSYDKLVSIEMIEAVGHRQFDTFFRVCGDRLRPDGSMLIQAILTPDWNFESSKRSVDFIKRYIFPGGQLPSLGAIAVSIGRMSDLRLTHLEDLSPHYATTLARWRAKMFENLDSMRDLGLSERFLKMWEFYLCYCEGGFREHKVGVAQLLFEKPDSHRDLVQTSLS